MTAARGFPRTEAEITAEMAAVRARALYDPEVYGGHYEAGQTNALYWALGRCFACLHIDHAKDPYGVCRVAGCGCGDGGG